ncbi:hypothetical protein Z947_2666 [Sulfitobacter geojensis]|nr:hypothetical protein Z947_2666 [Sulfitobacter geojensis]
MKSPEGLFCLPVCASCAEVSIDFTRACAMTDLPLAPLAVLA